MQIRFHNIDIRKLNYIHMKRLIPQFIFLLISFTSIAQNNNNVWYFGDGNFLDFNNVPPTLTGNGTQVATPTSTYCLEGSSTVCDATGQLLFYTDGRSVWDRNYNLMPNGTGLNGHLSSAQVLAVPQPGSNNIYYIFHTDYAGNANGLSFSVVDISLNGGFGDVTTKNTLLHTPASEHLKAITHCNGTDIWVLSHSATGNTFYAYLVSNTGVNTTAVTSNIGSGLATIFEGMSYMTCSKDGSRIAIPSTGSFELLDFDNQNGTLCNPINVPTAGLGFEPYGIEFSPDATKIYAGGFDLWQYDITSNVPATINGSAFNLGINEPAAIMRGPNDKLYVASGCDWYDQANATMFTVRELHVIDQPNLNGAASNVQAAQYNTPRECGLGLPTCYYPTQTGNTCGPTLTADFTGLQTICENDCINFTNNSVGPIVTQTWDFPGGTPANFVGAIPPAICYANAGTYNASLTIEDCAGNIDVHNIQITVNACTGAIPNFTTPNTTICENDCIDFQDLSVGTNIQSWSWDFPGANTTSSNDQNPMGICYTNIGNYDVTLTIVDDFGTWDTTFLNYIEVVNCDPPVASFTMDNEICAGDCISFNDLSTGAVSWDWTFQGGTPATSNQQNPTICFNDPGTFDVTLTVTNPIGLTDDTTMQISVNVLPFVDAGIDLDIDIDETVQFQATADPGLYSWTPSGNLSCFDCLDPEMTTNEPGTYTLTVTDANGCSASDQIEITANYIEEPLVYVPNAFTPDGDGTNDTFFPTMSLTPKEYSFQIFNRWGQLIFDSSSPGEVWDGSQLKSDIYVWRLKATFYDEQLLTPYEAIGHVTLVR